ncbi:hypothetical protein LUZ62_076609 [Rhynchospora pubera]|uniref:UBA domain-containing protein n=1 Tax=Rhynchospora pubera TaxID=906938 RepID=A0AAV8DE03_9POAL|nr:hypothetical protein LUZ62_076609 [Rhynchospora pubera]
MNPIIGSYFKSYSEENCNYCAYCFNRSTKQGHYVEVHTDDAHSKRSLEARALTPSLYPESDELRMSTILSSGGTPMMDKTHKRHDIPVGHCSKSFQNYHGVQCEVCGANPIAGRSYTKKNKYKVCSFCYSRMAVCCDSCEELTPPRTTFPPSNDHEVHCNTFASIDGTQVMQKDRMYFSQTYERYRSSILSVGHSFPLCLVQDVTIPVGTRLAPNTLFTKVWRIKNTSSFLWSSATRLTKLCGIYGFSTPWDVKLKMPNLGGIGPHKSVDVYLHLRAPSCPGNYSALYSLASLTGVEFGEPILIAIEVVANPSASKNTTAIKMPGSPSNVAASKLHAVSVRPTTNTDNSEVLGKSKVSMRSCTPGKLGKGAAIVEDDDDDLDEMMVVEDLVQMGYGNKDLNLKVLRSNNHDVELTIDALECISDDSPSDD